MVQAMAPAVTHIQAPITAAGAIHPLEFKGQRAAEARIRQLKHLFTSNRADRVFHAFRGFIVLRDPALIGFRG